MKKGREDITLDKLISEGVSVSTLTSKQIKALKEELGSKDEEALIKVLSVRPNLFKLMRYKTAKMCEIAIKANPSYCDFIDSRDEHLALEIVKLNGMYLKYLKCRTPLVCKVAIENDRESMQFVPNNLKMATLISKLAE